MAGGGGTLEKEMEVGECETDGVVLAFFFSEGKAAWDGG